MFRHLIVPLDGSREANVGVPHAYRPAGTSPLVSVQLFLPPGPEQRFKKLASGGN